MDSIATDTDRGQAGLGTVIVFLSLVIIGAIAAGVLLSTADTLETHAEATGEESTQQVADRIDVIGTLGYTNESATAFNQTALDGTAELHRLEVTVQPGPGTEVIDLEETTIEVLADEMTILTYRDVDAGFDGRDFHEDVALDADDSGFFAVREHGSEASVSALGNDDRAEIVIPLGTYDEETEWIADDEELEQPARLEHGATAELTLTTAQGSQRATVLYVPDSLTDDPAVKL
ncbi:archaellin/type IV pilin N-terminal domain-containing protein [Natrarchaeobaculum sulfurireducens]|uniref:Flagellin n=1 Tax=Natrarchaeobaculum sulfurireducens TaxID=2044521 RepID=A0A346PQC4_9EURY|nr:archaellin/type IV pilin N-terminal domain-containing protein [Natrarchaeobaculum sulfurireducens]AXR81719.1 Flagellin FlaB [Natrarchaeobaculum sulfurireducens]